MWPVVSMYHGYRQSGDPSVEFFGASPLINIDNYSTDGVCGPVVSMYQVQIRGRSKYGVRWCKSINNLMVLITIP